MSESSRIRTYQREGEVIPNFWPDMDWAGQNRHELFKQFGRGVALIYEQKVIGFGRTKHDAILDAEKNLPADIDEVTPVTFVLPHELPRFPFRVVYKETSDHDG